MMVAATRNDSAGTSAIVAELARVFHSALPSSAGMEPDDIAELLTVPPDTALGDLAFPCFKLAKTLRKAPQQIAAELASAVQAAGIVASARASGPYVNIEVTLGVAAQHVLPKLARGLGHSKTFRHQRVMVEYSQPNTHKAFHVGHMRNLCLGDALVRLLRADGYEVVGANYLGDVGAHIAKCLWWFLDVLSDDQRVPPKVHRGEWLGEIYTQANTQLELWEQAERTGDIEAARKRSDARLRIADILRRLELREPDITAIWRETRQWSLDEFAEIYAWSEIHFDRVFYESEVDEAGLALVDEYLEKRVFVISEGAVGIENPEIKHMPFFLLRKRDGSSLYSTKDLALARLKFEQYAIERSIYVVDSRQTDHFRHVFLTLQKMGFSQAARCEHVPYEMVELPDGPMATRRGNVILFRDLRETMETHVVENYLAKFEHEWSPEEIAQVAHAVALGAIKYGMLNRDVNQKIVFDMDAWLDLEGNTGPYLQYAHARIASILRKCEVEAKTLSDEVLSGGPALQEACAALIHPEERELVLALDGIGQAARNAAQRLRPSELCTYLFALAKTYNRFNKACNVKQSTGAVLQGRLLLVRATLEGLRWGLDLLGIPAPHRM